MFRCYEWVVRCVCCALVGMAPVGSARAQTGQTEHGGLTIADITAAQRALIEAEVLRTIAKARGGPVAGSAPGAVTVPAPSAAAPIAVIPAPALPSVMPRPAQAALTLAQALSRPPAPEERLLVTGQALVRGTWRAEVVTDGGVFLLVVGDAVPGTLWHVADVQAGIVTLSKPGVAASKSVATASRKVAAGRASRARAVRGPAKPAEAPPPPPLDQRTFRTASLGSQP